MLQPTTKTKKKVLCYCDECEGKLVDPRTKLKHEAEDKQMNHLFRFTEASKPASKRTQVDNKNDDDDNETLSLSESSSLSESQKSIHLPTKQERKEKFKVVELVADNKLICELDLLSNEDTEPNSLINDDQNEDLDDDVDKTSNDK
ncbi:hypothetical protein RclHR1_20450004 [Rhizophagus clarus]|uniref:Uncharacterized protein n=1 Tax=Rhizophagus clarus TaxID=94130 RepID=A0A2Z6QRN5_9GLOM|nr:hypothetical protein RclHR1_20450004 [Rhizophagus clarus]GES98748.1 hypothetical protein GLOIN_2v1476780 [Rhizophagus clarus]